MDLQGGEAAFLTDLDATEAHVQVGKRRSVAATAAMARTEATEVRYKLWMLDRRCAG